jgi:hypothetical protein
MGTSWNVQTVLEKHWREHVNCAQKRYVRSTFAVYDGGVDKSLAL